MHTGWFYISALPSRQCSAGQLQLADTSDTLQTAKTLDSIGDAYTHPRVLLLLLNTTLKTRSLLLLTWLPLLTDAT